MKVVTQEKYAKMDNVLLLHQQHVEMEAVIQVPEKVAQHVLKTVELAQYAKMELQQIHVLQCNHNTVIPHVAL